MNQSMAGARVIGLFIFGIFLLYSCISSAVNPEKQKTTKEITEVVQVTTCKLSLNTFVRQGPHLNDVVSGELIVDRDNFDGQLIEKNGDIDAIFFSIENRVINFALNTKNGKIYGTGTMESSFSACSGSGGGTFSGPAFGDLGDWRGEWGSETHTETHNKTIFIPTSNPNSQLFSGLSTASICASFVGFALLLYLLMVFIMKKVPSRIGKASNVTLRKATSKETSDGLITEYLAAYTAGDQLFDLSFGIEKGTQYFGECGLNVAKTLDKEKTQVTALEVWLFDRATSQTLSQILLSDYCYDEEILRKEMERKGEIAPIHPGATLIIETQILRTTIKIMALDYEATPTQPKSVFKRVVTKVSVFKKEVSKP